MAFIQFHQRANLAKIEKLISAEKVVFTDQSNTTIGSSARIGLGELIELECTSLRGQLGHFALAGRALAAAGRLFVHLGFCFCALFHDKFVEDPCRACDFAVYFL